MPDHEVIGQIYSWMYNNGDPGEGSNPRIEYLERMRSQLASERATQMSVKSLGWIHMEIFNGRWRPGRY